MRIKKKKDPTRGSEQGRRVSSRLGKTTRRLRSHRPKAVQMYLLSRMILSLWGDEDKRHKDERTVPMSFTCRYPFDRNQEDEEGPRVNMKKGINDKDMGSYFWYITKTKVPVDLTYSSL